MLSHPAAPACSPWTLSVLRASTITSLTFSVGLPVDVAVAVLPLVFAAAINITTLSVVGCLWDIGKISLPSLPNLVSLHAYPGLIIRAIESMHLPQLKSICTHHTTQQQGFRIGVEALHNIFVLLDALHLTPAVSLDTPFITMWIGPEAELSIEDDHPLMRVVELVIDPTFFCNVGIPTACTWLQNFPRITRLVMDQQRSRREPPVKAGHIELLLDAIAHTHPCLREVEILDRHYEVPRVNEVSKGSYVFQESRVTGWERNVPFTAENAGVPRSSPRVTRSVNVGA